jgi:hypothetical protein
LSVELIPFGGSEIASLYDNFASPHLHETVH